MIFYKSNAAFEHLKGLFRGQIARVDLVNRERHMILYLKSGEILYCLFKSEPIHSFTQYAKESGYLDKYPEDHGWGESINTDWLFFAKKLGGEANVCRIVYIYRDGGIYFVYPRQIINRSFTRLQIKSHTYIKDSREETVNEREAWFTIKLLNPLEVEA